MHRIADGYVYPEWVLSLRDACQFPEVPHRYGSVQPANVGPLFWMSYVIPGSTGTIKFMRRCGLAFPMIGDSVCKFLSAHVDYPFKRERVNMVWTVGSIPPHTDESGRQCAINIGLLNSSTSVTVASRSTGTDWKESASEVRLQDGSAYLLDTSSMHQVVADQQNVNRLMLTYAFPETYDEIYRLIRNRDESTSQSQ